MTTLINRIIQAVEVPAGTSFEMAGIGEVAVANYIIAWLDETNGNVDSPWDPTEEDTDESEVRWMANEITWEIANGHRAGDVTVSIPLPDMEEDE